MASRFSRARATFANPITQDAIKVLAWVPVALFAVRHIYSIGTITGISMSPTFNDNGGKTLHNDVVLLERWSVALGHIKRGDVVTFWKPSSPNDLAAKRVVAVEGDIVTPRTLAGHSVRIGQGQIWVEGDNPSASHDSSSMGPIPLALVDAKVSHVIWPLNRSGRVSSTNERAERRVKRATKTAIVFHE